MDSWDLLSYLQTLLELYNNGFDVEDDIKNAVKEMNKRYEEERYQTESD